MTHIRKCEEIVLKPEIWWHDGTDYEADHNMKWPHSVNIHIFWSQPAEGGVILWTSCSLLHSTEKRGVVFLEMLSSLAAMEGVILTTCGAVSDEGAVRVRTFPFYWAYISLILLWLISKYCVIIIVMFFHVVFHVIIILYFFFLILCYSC